MSGIKEIWKDVPGYGGRYRVSNLGRVQSCPSSNRPKKYISSKGDKNGYLRVSFTKEGKTKTLKIQRVVLSTFNPIAGWEDLTVNHINLKKTDNRLVNLEWATIQENNRHARANVEWNVQRGVDNYAAQLTKEDLQRIYLTALEGYKDSEIAEKLEISYGIVRELMSGCHYIADFMERRIEIILKRKEWSKEKAKAKQLAKDTYSGKFLTEEEKDQIRHEYFYELKTFDVLVKEKQVSKHMIDKLVSSVPQNSEMRKYRKVQGGGFQAGTKNGRAKLTPVQVLDIVREFKEGRNKSQLSRDYKISRPVIQKILDGRLWSSVTGIIEDKDV